MRAVDLHVDYVARLAGGSSMHWRSRYLHIVSFHLDFRSVAVAVHRNPKRDRTMQRIVRIQPKRCLVAVWSRVGFSRRLRPLSSEHAS